MPPDKNLDSYLHIRLTVRERLQLAIVSAHQGVSKGEFARKALQEALRKPENQAILDYIAAAQEANQFHLNYAGKERP